MRIGAQLRPLLPLSLNSLARSGSTDPDYPEDRSIAAPRRPFGTGCIWRRSCRRAARRVVWLTAADQPAGITAPAATWYPHAFGDADMSSLPRDTPRQYGCRFHRKCRSRIRCWASDPYRIGRACSWC